MKTLDLQTEVEALDALDGKLAQLLRHRRLICQIMRDKRRAAKLPAEDPSYDAHTVRRLELLVRGLAPLSSAIVNWSNREPLTL